MLHWKVLSKPTSLTAFVILVALIVSSSVSYILNATSLLIGKRLDISLMGIVAVCSSVYRTATWFTRHAVTVCADMCRPMSS